MGVCHSHPPGFTWSRIPTPAPSARHNKKKPMRESAWAVLARQLQLGAYESYFAYEERRSFRWYQRALGPWAFEGVSARHWLYGSWEGRPVLIVQYETGSSSRDRKQWVDFIVPIDPPLLLGLSLERHSVFSRALTPARARLPAEFERAVHITGGAEQRVEQLLAPQNQDADLRFLSALAAAVEDGLWVNDDTVTVHKRLGWTESAVSLEDALPCLECATSAAQQLGKRRERVTRTEAEKRRQVEWQSCADAFRLQFDETRMVISGTTDGFTIEVGLENHENELQTAIELRWPEPLGVPALLVRSAPSGLLQRWLADDLKTGNPDFDAAFRVSGAPPSRVQDWFGNPKLASKLLAVDVETGHNGSLLLTDRRVSWVAPQELRTADELGLHLRAAFKIGSWLCPREQTVYR